MILFSIIVACIFFVTLFLIIYYVLMHQWEAEDNEEETVDEDWKNF
jgi:hypothetical protein